MNKLIIAEFQKIWKSRRFIIITVALVCVHIFLLWYINQFASTGASASAYRKLEQDMTGMAQAERMEFLQRRYEKTLTFWVIEQTELLRASDYPFADEEIAQYEEQHPNLDDYRQEYEQIETFLYTENLDKEMEWIELIYNEAVSTNNYDEFLQEIESLSDTLSGISIFQPSDIDTFSGRNILKTAQIYSQMGEIKINYSVSKGYTEATDYFPGDILMLVLVLFIASLVLEEKQNGMLMLIKGTPGGRGRTITAKIISLLVTVGILCVVFYGIVIAYYQAVYGLGDLTRSIQSIGLFQGCTLHINAGQYLLIYILSKMIVFAIIALGVLLLCVVFRSQVFIYLTFIAIIGVQAALNILIPSLSNFNIFKYLNIYHFISPNNIFNEYLGLNFFGYPVPLMVAAIITAVFTFAVLWATCHFCFCKRRERTRRSLLKNVKVNTPNLNLLSGHRLWKHEAFKLFWVNRTLAIILIFIAMSAYNTYTSDYYFNIDEIYYRQYMVYLEGDITDEKIEYLHQEQEKFDEAQEKIDEINLLVEQGKMTFDQAIKMAQPYETIMRQEPAFQRVTERYEYLQNIENPVFLYEQGYYYLFGFKSNNDILRSLFLVAVLSLCFYSVFGEESQCGIKQLLRTTARGRKNTANSKMLVSLAAMVPLYIAAFLPTLINATRFFGVSGLTSSAINLPAFQQFPAWFPLWAAIACLFVLRLLACCLMTLLVLIISEKLQNSIVSICLSLAVLGFPVILKILGIDILQYISALPLLSPGIFILNNQILLLIVYMVIAIVLSAIFVNRLKKYGSKI